MQENHDIKSTDKELYDRVCYLEECIMEDKPVGAAREMTKKDYIVAAAVTAVFLAAVIGGAFL